LKSEFFPDSERHTTYHGDSVCDRPDNCSRKTMTVVLGKGKPRFPLADGNGMKKATGHPRLMRSCWMRWRDCWIS